jgi:hypothetical protein
MTDSPPELVARLAPSVSDIAAEDWNACAGRGNPFVGHAFLSAMERSASVGRGTGWQPAPIILENGASQMLACAPAYIKSHSQGEYVFDQQWAHALENAGGAYYPKLQIASPFSPVPGPRLLLRDQSDAPALIQAIESVTHQLKLSSAHATFVADDQVALFRDAGWLIRQDSQFHWFNRGYASFDDFLAALSSRKRKAIRKERTAAQEGLEIVHLSGAAIRREHWDAFWIFYQDTGARKWGRPYLTRSAFDLMSESMGEQLLLILALRGGHPIAGALNIIGGQRLYGRYWGCTEDVPMLHFELCYYQAIDAAIARGLQVVEAGAQGGHKLARGYEPVATWSAHYIVNPSFRAAISDYLERERQAVAADIAFLAEMGPFKKSA